MKKCLLSAAAPFLLGCWTVQAEDGPNSSIYSNRLSELQVQLIRERQGRPYGEVLPPDMAAIASGRPPSWYEIPAPPPREVKPGDLITLRIDLGTRMNSDGQMQRRKNSNYDATLQDWIILQGLQKVYPDPQSRGNPRIKGEMNETFRALGDMDTSESLRFDVAAKISSVLPNGTLVIEANREVENNDEKWLVSLSGIIRREDIQPGNMVLSKDIADLRIKKRELGHVYDAYKRGWVRRWLDMFAPF